MNIRLKELRSFLKITQEEFAKKVGIKRNTLANYETGRNEPIDAVVFSICREFNVNENWLRTGEGKMFAVRSREEEIARWAGHILGSNINSDADEFMLKFVHMLSKLDIEDWKLLSKMATLMAEDNKKSQAD